jgi:hypothetical protein
MSKVYFLKSIFLFILLAVFLYVGCLDVLTDKEEKVINDYYIIYSAGSGYSFALKTSESSYTGISISTISELYLGDSLIIFKEDPLHVNGTDTMWYKFSYNKDIKTTEPINSGIYDSLKLKMRKIFKPTA